MAIARTLRWETAPGERRLEQNGESVHLVFEPRVGCRLLLHGVGEPVKGVAGSGTIASARTGLYVVRGGARSASRSSDPSSRSETGNWRLTVLDAEQNARGADQKSRGWSSSRGTEGTVPAPFICVQGVERAEISLVRGSEASPRQVVV